MLQDISKPDLDFVRQVQNFMVSEVKNSKPGGDIFSAINFSLEKISQFAGTKKYIKRLFIFTNGSGNTEYEQYRVDTLRRNILSSGVRVNIITIDFMEGYDPETNTIHGSSSVSSNQEKNA
mgnify:CR=1 FL=1